MYVGALCVLGAFNPALHVDVAHLLSSEESVIFKYDVVGVPDNNAQLVTTTTCTHTPTCSGGFRDGRGGSAPPLLR